MALLPALAAALALLNLSRAQSEEEETDLRR